MRWLSITGLLLVSLGMFPAVHASTPSINIYASSYSPVKNTQVTITAQLADANGIPIAPASTTITWTLSGSGSFSSSSTVTSTTSSTNGLGIATVTLFTVNSTSASCTITAAASGYTSGTSMQIKTVAAAAAAAAAKYIVTVSNSYSPVVSGGTTTQVTVTAQLVDADNNPVTTGAAATATVTWGTSSGSGGSYVSSTSSTSAGLGTVKYNIGTADTTYVFTAFDGTYSGSSLPVTTDDTTGLDAMSTPVAFIDYSEVQTLFDNNCIGCHGNGGQFPNYQTNSYTNIVGVTPPFFPMKYISKSDAGNSFIFRKIHEPTPVGGTGGGRMPASGPPYLTADEQQIFRDWINQGAHNIAGGFTVTIGGSSTPDAGSTVTVSAQLVDINSTPLAIHNPGMPVTWSLAAGSGGSFASTVTRTNENGIATVQFTTDTQSGKTYQFTATCGTYTGTSATSITTIGGPPTQVLVASSNYNPIAGSPVTITAQLKDQHNNNSPYSRTLVWGPVGTGSFAVSQTTTSGAGAATVTYTTSTTANTSVTVTATDSVTPTLTGSTPQPVTTRFAQYLITYTPNAAIAVGDTITVKAQLADGNGIPQSGSGQTVSFSAAPVGSGTFTPTSKALNGSGNASVSFLVGTKAQNITLSVDDTVAFGTLGITANPGPPAGYSVTATSTTPTVNASITVNAQLVDGNGNATTTGLLPSVTFSATGKGGSFSPVTVAANASGLATTTFNAASSAGLTTIKAADATNNGTLNITSQPAPAVKYIVTPAVTSATVGTTNISVTAQLSDTYDNPVSAVRTVSFSAAGVGGSFSPGSIATNGAGLATVNFNAPTVVGTDVLLASDGTYSGSSTTVTFTPGAANKYVLTVSTTSPVAGSSVQVSAQLTDIFGNALTSYSGSMTWTDTGVGGSFSSSTNVVNGVATTTFNTGTVANSPYTIKGTDGNGLFGQKAITSVAGPPTQCFLIVTPTNPVAGTSVTVNGQLADANGNTVNTSGANLIWSSNASGSFLNPTTLSVSGTVSNTFTTGKVSGVNYVISTTDGSAIHGSSAPFASIPGAAAAYKVSLSSSTPAGGTSVTVTAQLTDSNGNALATPGQVVTWSRSGVAGSFATPTSTTGPSGTATVAFTVGTVAGDVESITATTGAFTGTSTTLTTQPGTATKYVVTASSLSVSAGAGVRIAAQLFDAFGNTVPTAGTSVNWSTTTGTNGFLSTPSSLTDTTGTASVVLSTSPMGDVTYVVTASDLTGLTGSSPSISVAAFAGTTGLPPLITSPLTANTGVGIDFSYRITALGVEPITFDVSGLPQGLSLSGDTISGTVTGSGTYIVHVTATNPFGTDAIDLMILVAPQQALSLDKATVKINFAAAQNDNLSAVYSITLPDGTNLQNAIFDVQFGAASFSKLIQSASKPGQFISSSIVLSLKPVTKGSSSYMVTLKAAKVNLRTNLQANGFVNDDISHSTLTVPLQVTVTTTGAGTFYCAGQAALSYTAKKGKSGVAKK